MKRARLLRRVARGVSHICFYTLRLLQLDTYFRENTCIRKKREIRCVTRPHCILHAPVMCGLISRKDAIEEHVP